MSSPTRHPEDLKRLRHSSISSSASAPPAKRMNSGLDIIESGLELVPDRLRAERHKELDEVVLNKVDRFFEKGELRLVELGILGESVVVNSDGILDPFWTATRLAEEMRENPALEDELQAAWKGGDFQRIRLLKLLSRKLTTVNPCSDLSEQDKAMAEAWQVKYVGDHHKCLLRAIDKMTDPERVRGKIYWNYLPIVQSSGMGKSRLVDQVSTLIFTIPFNLRTTNEYPTPDETVRDEMLRLPPGSVSLYKGSAVQTEGFAHLASSPEHKEIAVTMYYLRARYAAILAGVVGVIHKEVERLTESGALSVKNDDSDLDFASEWRKHLLSVRSDLYARGVTEGLKLLETSLRSGELEGWRMTDAFSRACQDLCKVVPHREHQPWILFSFDEAHELSDMGFLSEDLKDPSSEVFRTPLDALLYVLDYVKDDHVFAVLLSTNSSLYKISTNSNLHKISPSRSVAASIRVVAEPNLNSQQSARQAPYVELPFDTWNGNAICVVGLDTLKSVCEPEYVCRFGRPLWWTRVQDKPNMLNDIFFFAQAKLLSISALHWNPLKPAGYSALAILSNRLILDIEPQREANRMLEDKLVASHMRVAYSAPSHLQYLYSSYPSEPPLVEAAAILWNTPGFDALSHLEKFLEDGLICKSDRGEAVCQFLFIRAYDECIHDDGIRKIGSEKARYHQFVPVVDLLRKLFSAEVAGKILSAPPSNDPNGSDLEAAFSTAWIRISHFARAGDSSILEPNLAGAIIARGAAWQCRDAQQDIAFLLECVHGDEDTPIEKMAVSRIAVQIMNDTPWEQAVSVSSNVLYGSPNVPFNERPHMIIVLDLGVWGARSRAAPPAQASVLSTGGAPSSSQTTAMFLSSPMKVKQDPIDPARQTRSSPRPTSPRYWISVVGCSPQTFNKHIVPSRDRIKTLLTSQPLLAEHARQGRPYVEKLLQLKPYFVEGARGPCFTWKEIEKPLAAEVRREGGDEVQYWVEILVEGDEVLDEDEKISSLENDSDPN